MADSAHLEKMGRELKCPICLSLLNSAVSLTCNHVFCNLCIMKSMKSGSSCPVCKVPYGRREVRPAPHMDNLVSIYKNMEVASGINIFVTQTAPLTKVSDELNQAKGERHFGTPGVGGTSSRKPRKKRMVKGKKTEELVKTNAEISGPHPVKPSFPAKKRVQVPQYPLSDTPTRPEKSEIAPVKSVEKESMDNSILSKEKLIFTEKGQPVFSPFFWLREGDDNEDDVGKSSGQLTEGDYVMVTPQKVPSFSDLKDSDNESPTTMTPTGGVHYEPKVAEAFDSEMFEWTQRACSPELCSTPIKKQDVNKDELDGIQERETLRTCTASPHSRELASENVKHMNAEEEAENKNVQFSIQASPKTKNAMAQDLMKKSNKRAKRANRAQSKRVKISLDEVLGDVPINSSKIAKNLNQGNMCANKGNARTLERRTSERGKKASFNTTATEEVLDVPTESIEPKIKNQGTKNIGAELGVSPGEEPGNVENLKLRCKARKSRQSFNINHQKIHKKKSENLKGDTVAKVLNEVSKNQGHEKENISTQLPVLSCLMANDSETPDLGEESNKGAKKSKNQVYRELRGKKRLKNSTDDRAKDWMVDEVLHDSSKAAAKEAQNDNVAKVLNEVPKNQSQEKENLSTQLPVLSCLMVNDSETPDLEEKSNKKAKKVKNQAYRELKGNKRLKNYTAARKKNCMVNEVLHDSSKAAEKEVQTITEPEDLETGVTDSLEIAEKVLAVAKDRFLRKCENVAKHTCCAFCQSSEDSEASGEMMHYLSGKSVAADYNGGSNVIHSHRNCTEWAPNVYFEDDTAINLETELVRSRRIKCSCCGIKGAALGCYEKSCRKSFHVTCAKLVPQCRWDTENFVILCPLHSSSKLPKEISGHQVKSRKRPIPKGESHAQKTEVLVKHGMSAGQLWKGHGSSTKWVLCCSALTMAEKETVSEFARLAGISVSKTWVSSVTHVIASTDENGTCRRTFKFLMGVLEGKWILKIDWIKACMKTMEPVDEEQYEISEDIHGIRDGPRLGRLRVLNQQSKLFNGFTFYFTGEFILSYKGYLQDLVVAAGGTVLQRKPISRDQGGLLLESSKSTTFIIYSLELPGKYDSAKKTMICNRRRADAEALAHSTGAKVASHSWVLDSIAACKLQTLV